MPTYGFASNHGLVTIGSTNHPEQLDAAIVDRPSRFDRKYHFDLPGEPERRRYAASWNARLPDALRLDETALDGVAATTSEFSFAYLKELFAAALMRLVLFTSLPFGVAAALLSGEWLACLLTWTLVTPAAVLFTLALGNGSSVANPVPARLGQRAQARPDGNQLGNGCLHLILYMLIVLILQVPQFVAGFTGAAWSGYVAALAVLALGFWIWKANLRVHSRALSLHFGEVADSVGKATDM